MSGHKEEDTHGSGCAIARTEHRLGLAIQANRCGRVRSAIWNGKIPPTPTEYAHPKAITAPPGCTPSSGLLSPTAQVAERLCPFNDCSDRKEEAPSKAGW
jgi:hypothetical protein